MSRTMKPAIVTRGPSASAAGGSPVPVVPPPEPLAQQESGDVHAGARQTSADAEGDRNRALKRKASDVAARIAIRGCVRSVARILTTILDAAVPKGGEGEAFTLYEEACDELKPIIDALWRAERNLNEASESE